MKTIFAISFSFLIAFQSVGVGIQDILLIEKLVQHAEYHFENHGDDFFTFMQKHYGSLQAEHEEEQKEDKHEHEKLPFQHISCHHVLTDVLLVSLDFEIPKVEINIPQSHEFHYQNLYSSLEKVSIFQPPQLA
ncbi:hypothetical protein [Aequorivita xiaoshiensis]|uniref:Uncharacterized protein n=1 Tax=Aequorivita xiaoshiensis TaxID=2874476 RepID=A0A9X1R4V3_9FLAO|nr:hypothetical protein [Aequorivita xiaoshiensis]MCG2431079.1 hypothetical protein [Aequorivita xiaoshiensis]